MQFSQLSDAISGIVVAIQDHYLALGISIEVSLKMPWSTRWWIVEIRREA